MAQYFHVNSLAQNTCAIENYFMGRKASGKGTLKPTIQIDPAAKARFVDWLDSRGNPAQGIMLGRLVNWFCDQPSSVQRVVMGDIDADMTGAYVDALNKIVDRLMQPPKTEGSQLHLAASPVGRHSKHRADRIERQQDE